MARYFNPTPSQYVSQFVPPNLDLMYKVAQEKAANDAALSDSLDKAEQDWKVKGGLFTNKQDAELFNQEVESNLSKIRDNFYSGNMDSFQASRALNRLQNVVKNNNKYRLYKLDEQYTKALQPKLVSGELNEALGVPVGGGRNSIDLRGGQLIVNAEIDPNATSEEQLGTWYNAQIPGDFAKEHPDFMHQASIPKIVEKLTKANSNYRLETKTGPNGEIIPIMVNRSNNKEVKGIIEEEVLKYANKYALENYNSTSRQSVDYMRRAGETVNDYAKRLASLIMPGITDVQQSSSTSANIWESGFNLYNKPEQTSTTPQTYSSPGITTSTKSLYGFFDPFGIDKLTKEFNLPKDFNFGNILTKGTKENEWYNYQKRYKSMQANPNTATGNVFTNIIQSFANAYEILRDPEDLDKDNRKLLNNFLNLNKQYKQYVGKDKLPLDVKEQVYTSLFNIAQNLNLTGQTINETTYDIAPIVTDMNGKQKINSEFQSITGSVKGKLPTVGELTNTTLQHNFKIFNLTDNEFVESQEELKDLSKTKEKSNITKFVGANSLPLKTGDPNFKAGVQISANGKQYIYQIQPTTEEAFLSDLYINGINNDELPTKARWIDNSGMIYYRLYPSRNGEVSIQTNQVDLNGNPLHKTFSSVAKMAEAVEDNKSLYFINE